MNKLIYLLKEKFPNYFFSYRVENSFNTGTLIIIYYDNLRIHLHKELIKYYSKTNGLYDFMFDTVHGLDKDQYFNLSTQYDVHEIFMKENIDFIRSMWNNYPTHLTVLEIKKVQNESSLIES